jgi:hypothetical protein
MTRNARTNELANCGKWTNERFRCAKKFGSTTQQLRRQSKNRRPRECSRLLGSFALRYSIRANIGPVYYNKDQKEQEQGNELNPNQAPNRNLGGLSCVKIEVNSSAQQHERCNNEHESSSCACENEFEKVFFHGL